MILLAFIIPGSAWANCSSPIGTPGKIIFDEDTAQLQYCNGQNWVALAKDAPASGWKQVVGGKEWSANFACGITNNGDGYCWGSDEYGKLGNGAALTANQTRPSPIAGGHKWKQIALGGSHACGIRTDNIAMCWGRDDNQQLGNGASTTTQHEPVEVSNNHQWLKLSLGAEHSCGLRTDGVAMCWGSDGNGRLGNDATGSTNIPGVVNGGHTWADISAGNNFTCGVTTAGAGYCWGSAADGRLGNGTTTPDLQTPGLISGHTFQSIAAGNSHACGLATTGAIYCWGGGGAGQLGNGVDSNSSSPVLVSGPHIYKEVAVGLNISCGLTTGDAAYCWGTDDYGGLGTAGWDQNTPTILSGGHTWSSLGMGYFNSCALRTDGEALCWGKANTGALGNGTTTPNAEAPGLISSFLPTCTLGTWTPSDSLPALDFRSLAYGKGVFVAPSASTYQIYSSQDGISWTLTHNQPANSVTYGGGRFVAVRGTGSSVSEDGINWTDGSVPSGNWNVVTYGNGMYVALANGTNNRSMYSTDGLNWTLSPHNLPVSNAYWNGITYANGMFVAVAHNNATAVITSTDGLQWTARTAPQSNWHGITYGRGIFVAVSDAGRVMTSANGINWSDFARSGSWADVIYANGLFMAAAWGGTNNFMTSENGLTWAVTATAGDGGMNGIAYGNGRVVGVGDSGTQRSKTTTCVASGCSNPTQPAGSIMFNNATRVMQWCDGTYWQAAGPVNPGGATIGCASPAGVAGDMIFNDDYKTVQYCDGGKWRGMGPSMCSEWNTYATPENRTNNSIHRVFFADNIFVAASGPTSGNNILTSTNGANWALTPAGATLGRAITHDGTKFVAIQAYTTRNVYTSTDGLSWTPHTNALPSPATDWEGIAYGDGVFIAIARNGRIAKSTNGTSWTNVTTLANSGFWWDVAYGNGRFVAGALGWSATNRVAVSTDGGNEWVMATDPKLEYKAFQNLKFRNGLFLGATNNDGIMSSTDGFTWTNPVGMPAGEWTDVEYDGSRYYAVSRSGANRLARSTNGVNWSAVTPPLSTEWFSLAYGNGNLVAFAGGVGTSGPAGNRAMRLEYAACENPTEACRRGDAAYGATCADGTRFAGISPDGGGKMYVTPTTNSTGRQWFNAQSGTPIASCTTAPPAGTGTCSTGFANTVTLAGLSTNYQAATLCRNLTYGGYNDWYLPSINELYVMQQNRVAIGGFNGQYYWSSTPQNSGNARYINFGPGLEISDAFKTQSYQVRCVRKE